MDAEEFEKRVRYIYDPVRDWDQQELLHALLMGHRPTIARYRAQVAKAERHVKELVAEFKRNPDVEVKRKPELMETTKEELNKELKRIPDII